MFAIKQPRQVFDLKKGLTMKVDFNKIPPSDVEIIFYKLLTFQRGERWLRKKERQRRKEKK